MTTTRLTALARQVADLAAAAPPRMVIPLPPAVAAYFDAHGARRPVWDGYRLGRPLPPERTALYTVHRHCEDFANFGEPVDVGDIQREVLVHGYIKYAWRTYQATWEDASRTVFGVEHDTV